MQTQRQRARRAWLCACGLALSWTVPLAVHADPPPDKSKPAIPTKGKDGKKGDTVPIKVGDPVIVPDQPGSGKTPPPPAPPPPSPKKGK